MSKENYKVYMHKNKTNNKIYVGQTSQTLNHRWNNGKGYVNCPYFYHAILKYGWDNFEHILLHDNLSKDDADAMEKFYIQKYESYKPECGYNISLGGSGLTGGLKYKDIYQYTLDGIFVKHYNNIAEILLDNPTFRSSAIRDCYNEIYAQACGYQWRSYYKEKVENVKEHSSNIGKRNCVYQYDLSGNFLKKFINIKEASEATGFERSGISKACNGHQRVFEGYQWSFEYAEKIEPVDIYVICQYGINGKLINTYNSPKEAFLMTGIRASSIVNCYHGNVDVCGGYIWKKVNTTKENIQDVIEVVLKKKKFIALIDESDNIVKVYYSAKDAAMDLGLKDCTGIWNVCKDKQKQTYGYRFKSVSRFKLN